MTWAFSLNLLCPFLTLSVVFLNKLSYMHICVLQRIRNHIHMSARVSLVNVLFFICLGYCNLLLKHLAKFAETPEGSELFGLSQNVSI